MALEAVCLTDENCGSIRVNVVVCANNEAKRETMFENQANWQPLGHVGHIVEHGNEETNRQTMYQDQSNWEDVGRTDDETRRDNKFENQCNWEPVADIMENAIAEAKRETKFEDKNWKPVEVIMDRAMEAKRAATFENKQNWEPIDDVMESAIEEARRETFEGHHNWEPVRDDIDCADNEADSDRMFENDHNWAPERDVEEFANHETRQTSFENKSNWEAVGSEKKHANHETRESTFENSNWKHIDNEIENTNDEASRETMFENDSHWEPMGDTVQHDTNEAKQETLFQVLPKQCIKENPNWEDAKSIGDIYLNQQIELLQSSNLYFTLQGQPSQSTLNEYQPEVSERRFIEINKGTPGKVVQIPISLLQDPGFSGQLPFEIPVPPLIPLTKRTSSVTTKQAQPNECPTDRGKLPESMPDFNSDNSIDLPPLVPIRKKHKNVDGKICTGKCCDKIHTETSVFKKPVSKDGDGSSVTQKKHRNRHRKFPCLKCDFIADHSYQLKIHISLSHDANNQFKCNYCDYKSKYKKALYQHQKTHTEFSCDICDYTCKQDSNLQIHQRTHKARQSVVTEARTMVHGAFQLCSNSTSVRSHTVGRTTHTYTNNQ